MTLNATTSASVGGLELARPTRLSPSALERYRQCAKSFRFADVERMRAGDDTGPTPTLTVANAVHESLELWHGLRRVDRTPDAIERALRSVWPKHRTRETFGSRDAEAAAGLSAIEMLRRYACSGEAEANTLAREHWLVHRLPNGIEIYGKVDRIDEGPDGTEVVDYKTGRRELEPEDLRDDPAAQVYLVCAEAALRKPVTRVRFIYLASGRAVAWEPEPEDVDATRASLVRLIDEIGADVLFEANPGPHCKYCKFALFCPESSSVELESLVPVDGLPF